MPFHDVFDSVLVCWASIAAGVFVLVGAVLLTAIVLNRAGRRNVLLFRATKNTRLEIGYAVLLAAVSGALVFGGFAANAKLDDGAGTTRADGPAERINVTAYRWCWDFAYQSAPVRVTAECRGQNFPTIVVPAGRPVEFALTSRDVVHAFWLPDFAAKRDAYPDHENTLRMVFPREGQWKGRCSEYCGTHHVTMDFYVRVVSPDEYQRYLHSGGAAA